MSATFGDNLKVTVFGESHGTAIGVVLDGLPPGIELDMVAIDKEMERRRPGKSPMATSRGESDAFEIVSGYFRKRTTGTPLCALIYNEDQRSRDYAKMEHLPRPGHADYTNFVKSLGHNDFRGGGHSSGRLTAPIVFSGAVARQTLLSRDIHIGSHVKSVEKVEDVGFDPVNVCPETLWELAKSPMPVLNAEVASSMAKAILDAKDAVDSVGGVIETAAINVPAGLGSPIFDSVESRLSHALFSIPAIKAVEFGHGFDMAKMRGSVANDEYILQDEKIRTVTNHNGGILGGITSGMPLIFRVAVKPTPSIGRPQQTVDISRGRGATVTVEGRHDPCIVPRAIPAVEAVTALVLLDFLLGREGEYGLARKLQK